MKEQIKRVGGTISIRLVSALVMLLPDLWSALEREDRILNKLLLWRHIFPHIWTDRNQINLNIWDTVLSDVFQYKNAIKSWWAPSVGGPFIFGFVGEAPTTQRLFFSVVKLQFLNNNWSILFTLSLNSWIQSCNLMSLYFHICLKLQVTLHTPHLKL